MNTQRYERGTRLLIELCNGKMFEGLFLTGTESKMAIAEVSQYPNKAKVRGSFQFFKTEIQSITVLEDDEDEKEEEPSTINNTKLDENPSEYDKLKDLAHMYKYVSDVDSKFHAAIEYIKICNEISVIGFGNIYGRKSRIYILAVATKREIFLFDIKIMGMKGFDMGLREILQSNILKTVHDSKLLEDCLQHIYNVNLKNVFDTQISDYMLVQKQEGTFLELMRNFPACISIYFNIPANIIRNFEVKDRQLSTRPLPEDLKFNAALQVLYLYTLKHVLKKKMCHNFNLMTDCYLNSMSAESAVKSLRLMNYDVPDKLKELGLTL